MKYHKVAEIWLGTIRFLYELHWNITKLWDSRQRKVKWCLCNKCSHNVVLVILWQSGELNFQFMESICSKCLIEIHYICSGEWPKQPFFLAFTAWHNARSTCITYIKIILSVTKGSKERNKSVIDLWYTTIILLC